MPSPSTASARSNHGILAWFTAKSASRLSPVAPSAMPPAMNSLGRPVSEDSRPPKIELSSMNPACDGFSPPPISVPQIGVAIVELSKKAVTTQERCASPPGSLAMRGRAVFTMLWPSARGSWRG